MLGVADITRETGDCNLTGLIRAVTERAAFRREGFFVHRDNISSLCVIHLPRPRQEFERETTVTVN